MGMMWLYPSASGQSLNVYCEDEDYPCFERPITEPLEVEECAKWLLRIKEEHRHADHQG